MARNNTMRFSLVRSVERIGWAFWAFLFFLVLSLLFQIMTSPVSKLVEIMSRFSK